MLYDHIRSVDIYQYKTAKNIVMEDKTDDSIATNMENEIQCINRERYDDTNEGQRFLLPNVNSRSPRIAVEYIRRPDMSRYNPALKNLIPIRREKEDKDGMPADSAGLFSYVFYTWITPYIWKAYKTGISIQDLPRISSYETCQYNAQRLEVLWQEELNKRGPHSASFSIVAWRFVRTRICIAWFLLICSTICGFISPMILMKKVLEHVQSSEEDPWVGIKWALLLTCCDFLRMVFFTWTWNTNIRTALRLKSACTTLLYKKIMRLNNLGNKSTGELTNLFTNDSQRLFDVIIYGPMIVSGPIIITCGVIYILWLFSPLALFGTFVFLIFYPCQYLISRIVGRFRSKTVVITDIRVKLMNEILECIKLIKMCSWEKYFSHKLLAIRKKEEHWLHKTVYFQSFAISLTPAVPVISAIVTFLAHLASGGNLTAAQAFPLTTFFGNMLRMALVSIKDSTRYFIDARIALSRFKVFPLVSLLNSQFRSSFMFLQVALVNIAESKIVFNRLQSVLLLEEFTCYLSKPIVKSQAIAITNGTFVYENSTIRANESKNIENKKISFNAKNKVELEKLNEPSNETQDVKVLADIKFEAAKGALIGICGHVGSGKSSLLLAALGQLRLTRGHVSREGSCAYVSQQAWIVNATLKENILFGSQFDAKRYYQALTVCNLKEDVNMLPGGDETEIGERGINLSGGQKQRVALARALYANRDIYFLDDPLSAVDVHVGSYIFKNLILGALKDKCVLFVTHQVQFLKHCDQIYLMKNGKIVEQGTHDELIQLKKEYVAMVNSALLETHGDTKEMSTVAQIKNSNSGSDLKVQIVGCNSADNHENGEASMRINREGSTLTTEEKVETGTVKLHTYHMYIKAAGGYIVAIIVFFTLFLNVGSSAFSSWWLATWIKAGGGNVTNPVTNETVVSNNLNDNPDFAYYQNIYGACIGAILFTSLLRGLVITLTTINASTTLHNKVFKKMIESSLTFFETTPSGRIQNIFSRDIDEVDSYIPISVENMVQNIFTCSFAIIFICSILPWFSIPFIILAAIFFYTSKVFRVAMRDLKRMESASRSPVLSFVTTTVHGLNTIHAFQKEKAFTNKFEELFDLHNLCLYLCQSAMRWSAARLDSLAIASASITAFLVIAIRGQISPALAGLAMAYSMQMTGVFQYTVRLMAETETRFISVERICYYLRTLQKEDTLGKAAEKPSNEWPTHGKLEFHKVQLRYRKELPLILNNISFTIKAGEHIGIVGRTGAGKSSLIVALFRLVEACAGKIKIDGVDIATVSLELLRNKLSIIPQDPVLFSGSIRSNLDPFNKHNDLDLWSALEKTRLKEKVILMPGQLDAFVEVGGNNMSVGERQLLCLTRALLRNTKVMILDEATAAVDPETEVAVQNTIQNEFSHCTVLTIAHRLKTVVSCDRVIVMKNGQIIEFDEPSVLMSDPNSEFSKMITSADKVVKEC